MDFGTYEKPLKRAQRHLAKDMAEFEEAYTDWDFDKRNGAVCQWHYRKECNEQKLQYLKVLRGQLDTMIKDIEDAEKTKKAGKELTKFE